MLKLRYLAQALDDIIEIKRYIASESGDIRVASDYTDKLRKQCRKLADLPGELGRARPELATSLRSFPFGNYVIFFKFNVDHLDIVTKVEGHRDIETLFEAP